jgi:hypothetical protein
MSFSRILPGIWNNCRPSRLHDSAGLWRRGEAVQIAGAGYAAAPGF